MKPLALLLSLTFGVTHAASLHGAAILAADGTFLGTCDGPAGFTSVGNAVSLYGSPVGMNSMYNTVSLYGSSVGLYSPYNTVTITAPYLLNLPADLLRTVTAPAYNTNRAAKTALAASLRALPLTTARVSVNTTYLNAIHPDTLRRVCRN